MLLSHGETYCLSRDTVIPYTVSTVDAVPLSKTYSRRRPQDGDEVNSDTKIITHHRYGTVVGTGIALGGLMFMQINGVNNRIDDLQTTVSDRIGVLQTTVSDRIGVLQTTVNDRIGDVQTTVNDRIGDVRSDIGELRTDVRGFDARLREVEVGFGKIDQRLTGLGASNLTDDPVKNLLETLLDWEGVPPAVRPKVDPTDTKPGGNQELLDHWIGDPENYLDVLWALTTSANDHPSQ